MKFTSTEYEKRWKRCQTGTTVDNTRPHRKTKINAPGNKIWRKTRTADFKYGRAGGRCTTKLDVEKCSFAYVPRVAIGAKIIHLIGWLWRGITHSVSKHMRLSKPTTKIWMKIDPYRQWRRGRQMTLVSGNIKFMRIFAGFPRQWGNRKRRFSGISDATSSAP